MEYRLVTDSCCELIPELREDLKAESVPMTLEIDGETFIDDESIDLPRFLAAIRASKNVAKSACPSPEMFAEKFRLSKECFGLTITSKLSGSYNSAQIASKLVINEDPTRRVHIFDSLSASAGEIAVGLKIRECVQAGLDFDGIVTKVSAFIQTFFILENLDTLIKSGRMSRIVGYVASAMSLRPIMTAEQGTIKLQEKARGSVRAFTRLVEIIGENCTDFAERTLVITHCNNERQANFLRAEAQKRYSFKAIHVVPTAGLSSMYANEGGVIIAF